MKTFRQDQIDRDFDLITGELRAPATNATTSECHYCPHVSLWTLRAIAAMGIAIAAILVWVAYSLAPIAGLALGLLSPALPLGMVLFAERHRVARLI